MDDRTVFARNQGEAAEASPADQGDGRLGVITEEGIARLVERFYARVREDGELGPVFEKAIPPGGWDEHLAVLRDFWSSLMLASGRYKGNPLAAHMRLSGLQPPLFPRWLALFAEAAHETFQDRIASQFLVKAERIAQSFQAGLFYRPKSHRSSPVRQP